MLILELNAASPEFSPGQTIAGRAGWQESRPPRNAALRLFWYTEGRGTQDIGIVAEQLMNVSQSMHEETF